jgi:hypothetical protein
VRLPFTGSYSAFPLQLPLRLTAPVRPDGSPQRTGMVRSASQAATAADTAAGFFESE